MGDDDRELIIPLDEGRPFTPLIGALFTQMHKNAAFTTNALIDNYKAQLLDREAELYAIRTEIEQLFNGPFAPAQRSIEAAVFRPSPRLIEEYKASRVGEET